MNDTPTADSTPTATALLPMVDDGGSGTPTNTGEYDSSTSADAELVDTVHPVATGRTLDADATSGESESAVGGRSGTIENPSENGGSASTATDETDESGNDPAPGDPDSTDAAYALPTVGVPTDESTAPESPAVPPTDTDDAPTADTESAESESAVTPTVNLSEFADKIRATLALPPGMNDVDLEADILPVFSGDRVAVSAFLKEYGLDGECQ